MFLLRKVYRSFSKNLHQNNFGKPPNNYSETSLLQWEKVSPNKNKKILKSELETAKVSNYLFPNIVKNLAISKFNEHVQFIENVKDPFFKAILKYENHPIILIIQIIIKR